MVLHVTGKYCAFDELPISCSCLWWFHISRTKCLWWAQFLLISHWWWFMSHSDIKRLWWTRSTHAVVTDYASNHTTEILLLNSILTYREDESYHLINIAPSMCSQYTCSLWLMLIYIAQSAFDELCQWVGNFMTKVLGTNTKLHL